MTHFDPSYCMLIKPKCGFQTQFFIGSIQKVPLIKSSIRDEYCLTTLGPNLRNLTRVFNCNWLIFEFHLLEPSNWTLFLGWLSLSSNQLIDPVKVKSNIHGHLDQWTTVKVNITRKSMISRFFWSFETFWPKSRDLKRGKDYLEMIWRSNRFDN